MAGALHLYLDFGFMAKTNEQQLKKENHKYTFLTKRFY